MVHEGARMDLISLRGKPIHHLIALTMFEKSSVHGLAFGAEVNGFQPGYRSRNSSSRECRAITTHSEEVAPLFASATVG